jgi:predicted phosphohydrolase
MQVTLISDTHGRHGQLVLPGGDLLIHAGDVSPQGRVEEVEQFLAWYDRQPYRYRVFIAGNHDWLFERSPATVRQLLARYSALIYLQDRAVVIGGLQLYGSPWSPEFCHWAFNRPRRSAELARVWAQIPDATDVLITHTAPYQCRDLDSHLQPAGCEVLARRCADLHLKLHVFGHFHASYGQQVDGATVQVNASTCTEQYEPDNPPITLTL